MTSPEPAAEPQVLFRAGKKRKIYRQRPQEPQETTTAAADDTKPVAASAPAPPEVPGAPLRGSAENDDEEEGLSVAEVIRRRNARKHRLGGVGFHARTLAAGNDTIANENTEQGMVLHDTEGALKSQYEADILAGIPARFAPQTGLIGELVNKNM